MNPLIKNRWQHFIVAFAVAILFIWVAPNFDFPGLEKYVGKILIATFVIAFGSGVWEGVQAWKYKKKYPKEKDIFDWFDIVWSVIGSIAGSALFIATNEPSALIVIAILIMALTVAVMIVNYGINRVNYE